MSKKKPERVIIVGATQCNGWLYRSDTAEETRRKIAEAKSHPFPPDAIFDGQQRQVTWDDYANVAGRLVSYREKQGVREDGSCVNCMADRPPVLVVAIDGGKVVQLDWYTGHDFLTVDRLFIDTGIGYAVPNFADRRSYGDRIPGFGMVAWHLGSFQTTLADQDGDWYPDPVSNQPTP